MLPPIHPCPWETPQATWLRAGRPVPNPVTEDEQKQSSPRAQQAIITTQNRTPRMQTTWESDTFRLQQPNLAKEHLEGHRQCPGRELGRGLGLTARVCLTKHGFFRAAPWVCLTLSLRMHARNLGKRGSSISLAKSAVGPLQSLTGKGGGKTINKK